MFKNTKLIGLFSLTACFLSTGIVAPVLSQPQSQPQSQEYPTQVATDGSPVPTTWELKSCARKQNSIVSCILSLTRSSDGGYGISTNKDTKIVDAEGNEYYPSKVQVGKRIAGPGSPLTFDMAQNANYPTTIDFTGVPTSVSQITLLQIWNGGFYGVKFRNVPIINLDGSFTVIPSSERAPVNRQPANTNNSTPRRKVCLPIVGCL